MARCEAPDLALIEVQLASDVKAQIQADVPQNTDTTGFVCPVRPGYPMLDRSFVRCPLPKGTCPIIQKMARDQHTSYVNIVHFKSHLPTTDHAHDGPALTEASRWKR